MCKAFSVVVSNKGKVFWQAGLGSHDQIFEHFKLTESTHGDLRFARVEIVPDNDKKYPYLYPDLKWKLLVDEKVKPSWLCPTDEQLAWDAHAEWKKIIYHFDYKGVLKPINPLEIKMHTVSQTDKLNLKKWASVRVSVYDSVKYSVWASVGASVWAYISGMFPDIKEWKYAEKLGEHPYQPCIDLWKRGFVPSFDGKVWRLHSGKDAKIVFEITKEELHAK